MTVAKEQAWKPGTRKMANGRIIPEQPANKQPLWRIKPKAIIDEMAALLADRENSFVDIAEAYGVSTHSVATLARHLGAPPRRFGPKFNKAEIKQTTSQLSMVDRQIATVAAKRAELEAELEKLKLVREELSIRFEWDGQDVLVYGVADEPLRALAVQWKQFLDLEGARKLREFLTRGKK